MRRIRIKTVAMIVSVGLALWLDLRGRKDAE
jgi:hypothetical protein